MDHRTALKFDTVLHLGEHECHIEELLGSGSNSIVYKAWYYDRLNTDLKHHVLIKELFPFHPQRQIYRAENGAVEVAPEAMGLWESHRTSFETGNAIHLKLLEAQPELMAMGTNINSFRYNGTLYSILGWSGGRSLKEELNRSAPQLRGTVHRVLALLDALEAFHESGYLHLDISPDNIMLTGQDEKESAFLIDYNSVRPMGCRERGFLSSKPGFSAPELFLGNLGPISPATDLYSVAAVFYRCLMGKKLSPMDTLRKAPPDCAESPLLENAPQTVRSMVSEILGRGLKTLARERYQSIGEMRAAFRELLDRIDCVGVTHWALWENGRRSVDELIRANPALRYLDDEKRLYPMRLEGDGSLSLSAYLEKLISPQGSSAMVLAEGGMGKTTMLLHTARLLGRQYSREMPAVFYITLAGWTAGDSEYIRRQLLLRLRFKPGENSYDSALHALHKLLEQPLDTRAGERPAVLLLLDGFNEAGGDITALIKEINLLNKLAGLRLLVSSRTGFEELETETVRLMPLNMEDVEQTLGENGLLLPQKQDILQLLRTPLILSIYVQTGENGNQPEVGSKDELMKAYMDSLLEKELRQLPENSPRRWQVDVALNYVLPAIAAETKKKKQGLTQRQLLKVVERCWRNLHSKSVVNQLFRHSRFFGWIVHSRAVFEGAKNAKEWYTIIAEQLLWQKIGVLTKEEENYRVFHQSVCEYLEAAHNSLTRQLLLRQWLRTGAVALLAALLLWVVYPHVRSYDDDDIKRAVDWSAGSYVSYGSRYEALSELTGYLLEGDTEGFDDDYPFVLTEIDGSLEISPTEKLYSRYIEEYILPEKASRVSWSGQDFEGDLALELLNYSTGRMKYYRDMLPALDSWARSREAQLMYPRFPELFQAVLEADAAVVSELYHQVCAVHLVSDDELWEDNIRALIAEIPLQEAHRQLSPMDDRQQYLENLRKALQEAERLLAEQLEGVRLAAEHEAGEEEANTAAGGVRGGGGWTASVLIGQQLESTWFNSSFYKDEDVESGIEQGALHYAAYAELYGSVKELLLTALSGDKENFSTLCDELSRTLEDMSLLSQDAYRLFEKMENDISDAPVKKVSWSYLPFDWEMLQQLINTPRERAMYYSGELSFISYLAQTEGEEALTLILELLEADMARVREIYYISCGIHLDGKNSALEQIIKSIPAKAPLFVADRASHIRTADRELLHSLEKALEEKEEQLSDLLDNEEYVEYRVWDIRERISENIGNSEIYLP